MNIIDVIIIVLLLLGAISGFKKGVIRTLTSFIGLVVVIILAFLLKNPVSVLLYENLPFFTFGGVIKGIEMLNILVYELISFLIVFLILSLALRVIISISGLLEKILKATIILGIPSKILGAVVGFLESYIYIFIILFILSQPFFKITLFQDSKGTDFILNNTPVISDIASNSLQTYSTLYDLINKHNGVNTLEVNAQILELFLENKVITVNSAEKLIEKDKLHVENADAILNKYREE